mmetsp:Transcript_85960/g.161882  ORF Transcript_85960/g.161882 Transcript_85960/m.161882 type:complete len:670 (-) Transcript_85960:43-2052(-)
MIAARPYGAFSGSPCHHALDSRPVLLLVGILCWELGTATLDMDEDHSMPIQPAVRVSIAGSSLLQIDRNRFRSDVHNSHRKGAQGLHDAASTNSNGTQRQRLHAAASTHSNGTQQRQKDLPAGWFGGFLPHESTFERSGVGDSPDFPEREVRKAPEHEIPLSLGTRSEPPYYTSSAIPASWFEESRSGGPHAAWRTRYPPLEAFNRHGVDTMPFYTEDHHRVKHTYLPNIVTASHKWIYDIDKKPAEWFNENVAHYDDFGRYRPPSKDDERYYWDWTPMTWTANFGCPEPGCTATAELTTMDMKELQFVHCKLNVDLHPTDYDDEYSREYVEWIKVYDRTVKTHCDPVAKGCEHTYANKKLEEWPIYPCVADVPIGELLKAHNGKLVISGKITDMVDECPAPNVNGNLLSGIVTVRCLTKPWPAPKPPVKKKPPVDTEACAEDGQDLRCHESGCTATTPVAVCKEPEEGQKCTLSLKVYHTDFDSDHGSVELIEWIKLGEKEIATRLFETDGRNPCKEVFEGKAEPDLGPEEGAEELQEVEAEPRTDSEKGMLVDVDRLVYGQQEEPQDCRRRGDRHLEALRLPAFSDSGSQPQEIHGYGRRRGPHRHVDWPHLRAAPDVPVEVISGLDVTEQVFSGEVLEVSGKISEKVDECGKDGYLFNAKVLITCK